MRPLPRLHANTDAAVLALPGVVLAAVILPLTPVLESVMLPRLQFRVGMDVSVSPRVVMFTSVIAVIDVVLATALDTLASFLYNMSAGFVGGIELTLAEDE